MKKLTKVRSKKARHGEPKAPERLQPDAVHRVEQGRIHSGKRFGRVWYPHTKAE